MQSVHLDNSPGVNKKRITKILVFDENDSNKESDFQADDEYNGIKDINGFIEKSVLLAQKADKKDGVFS